VPSQRFAVEFERRTVGIAVRVPGGFMFFASSDEFEAIDGRLFPRARVLERELKKVARNRRRLTRQRRAQPQAIPEGAIS
jgi:hypothetical protein